MIYVKDYIRTPHGRSKGGMFRDTDAKVLTADLLKSLTYAHDPKSFDEVIWGCVQQFDDQGHNLARNAALTAGMDVPALTVNRLCASGMTAIQFAVANMKAGMGKRYIVGGTEHMGHCPMMNHYHETPAMSKLWGRTSMNMAATAELLAATYGISRADQEDFARRSHDLARVKMSYDHVMYTQGTKADGNRFITNVDETIRTADELAGMDQLKSLFPGGTLTAATSSGVVDGSSGMILDIDKTNAIAEIVDVVSVSLEPSLMGLGPVGAISKLLWKNGLAYNDIHAWEINEAFAAQTLAVIREAKIDESKVNLLGGSIAIGHPLGSSGCRIVGTLISSLRHIGRDVGVATLCVGGGQGMAILVRLL